MTTGCYETSFLLFEKAREDGTLLTAGARDTSCIKCLGFARGGMPAAGIDSHIRNACRTCQFVNCNSCKCIFIDIILASCIVGRLQGLKYKKVSFQILIDANKRLAGESSSSTLPPPPPPTHTHTHSSPGPLTARSSHKYSKWQTDELKSGLMQYVRLSSCGLLAGAGSRLVFPLAARKLRFSNAAGTNKVALIIILTSTICRICTISDYNY